MTSRAVIGLGDSITNSCGFPSSNLPLASWAQWVARAVNEPVELFARPGASCAEIERDLLPPASYGARLALVYVGTNDILRGADPDDFEQCFDRLLARACDIARTVLVMTPPLWLGALPTIAPYGFRRVKRIHQFGDVIRQRAIQHSAEVVQAPELYGPAYVAPDRIHPTAAGQLAFADAATWKLRDLGWSATLPSYLAGPRSPLTSWQKIRWHAMTLGHAVKAPPREAGRTLRRALRDS
ncbi:SGNH/GDSL hydrolase family protein [Actinomycetospora sp. CA-101289]|uniref:SGNH/GDSL hydrolase family protein n=1 Tax=Actinomycetospora sp. CA-101289 TaxID=3239893 RepID=UPI003D97946B